jgi:hypothetical protein
MKGITFLILTSLAATTYLIGGPMTQLSDAVKILPSPPMELNFDVPFRNHPAKGTLKVYSSTLPKSVFVLSSLHTNEMTGEILKDQEAFKKSFERLLVGHLFYHPEVFQQHQKFHFTPDVLQGHPCLNFQFSYLDKDIPKVINGVAVVMNDTLYHLFYMASAAHIDDEIEGYYSQGKEELSKILFKK